MFFQVNSGGIHGIEGYFVQVEADVSDGLPYFNLVGYLSSEVKEAQERVRTAIKNAGFFLPPKKITVNLSPANVRKAGTAFDLPIAVAVLGAHGKLRKARWEDMAFLGELGLDGAVKPVLGTLSVVLALKEKGIRRFFLPQGNLMEALTVEGIEIYRVNSLKELVEQMNQSQPQWKAENRSLHQEESEFTEDSMDYKEVQGQGLLKRATEVAAAGRHNILYLGPAGSGKSMVARRIPTILPPMTSKEQLEITKIQSVCGLLPAGATLVKKRLFRAPHHSISAHALVGGGTIPRPGEISLASRGVLFLDELPEFKRGVLELLRQPLEEKQVTISRIHGAYLYPASFMLVAAMNPCRCGFYPDRNRCSCTENQVRQYLGRISRPLLDRIDICVEAAPISFEEVRDQKEKESSKEIRQRVEVAWEIQKKRFLHSHSVTNGDMGSKEIGQYCQLGLSEDAYFQKIYQGLRVSMRGCHRILKVARTIADLDQSKSIQLIHLMEAAGYRGLEEKIWGKGNL